MALNNPKLYVECNLDKSFDSHMHINDENSTCSKGGLRMNLDFEWRNG